MSRINYNRNIVEQFQQQQNLQLCELFNHNKRERLEKQRIQKEKLRNMGIITTD